jgi:hypothetical protein
VNRLTVRASPSTIATAAGRLADDDTAGNHQLVPFAGYKTPSAERSKRESQKL